MAECGITAWAAAGLGFLAPAPDHPAAEMFPTAAAKAGANA